MQLFEMLNQRDVLLAQILIALQNMPDFGVGQTRVRAHHRFVEFVARQAAFRRNRHLAHHTQAVYLRVERTQAVREHFRQHRDNLRREVHRRATVTRFSVQRRWRTHIVADVGNRDP
ncbi:Uncharacterised protein [Shigella sonnei]|nr:Uncharacterised protein [Shigella sonnei]CSF49584.1 Uncharacterised protein [Shigella sonnei]CSF99636.1 Uncharacterised protein [Shigella sonnei]